MRRYLPDGYGANGPIDAISSYEQVYGRPAMVDRMRDELRVDDVLPGGANLSFARIPFDIVVTTNVDFVFEDSRTANR